jgi:periplasmic divalent cation tolerance protein
MADLEAQYLQVQTTTDSRVEAMELSRAAVESRLAACAQVAGPVASMFWWDGALERTEEWLVLLKLPADRYDELAAFITERHSYDEPEIIALPIVTGSAAYLNWLREETRPADPAPGALGRPTPAGRYGAGDTFQDVITGSACSVPRVLTVPVSSRNSRPSAGGIRR